MRKSLAMIAALLTAACSTLSAPPAVETAAAVATWNAAGLEDLARYAEAQKSTGLVVIQDKRVILERYWPLPADAASQRFAATMVHGKATDGALLEDVASQQKSFIAILVGVAIDKGLLDISQPVSRYAGAGWSKAGPAQEAAITVRNLLEMNSGLTESLGFETAPGQRFFYNTPAYAILKRVLEGAANRPLDDITQEWLARPAGMTQTGWRKRPAAMTDVGNPTGLVTTPRDIAAMGQLVLDGGVAADGRRVISRAQLDALFVRTQTNPSYGRLWWLNGGEYAINPGPNAPRRAGQLIPSAPRDLVAALGAQDRKLFVVPSQKLIVVRTGQAASDRDFNEALWKLINAASARP